MSLWVSFSLNAAFVWPLVFLYTKLIWSSTAKVFTPVETSSARVPAPPSRLTVVVSVTVLFTLSGCCSSSLFEQPVITVPINARAAMLKYLIVFVIASSI